MKYRKYLIIIIFILIIVTAFVLIKFNLDLKFLNVKNITMHQNPNKTVIVKNKDNINKIINLLTDSRLKRNGKNEGKGCIFVVEIDDNYVEIQTDTVVINGIKYISKDSKFMTSLVNEFSNIYLQESKNTKN